MNKFSTKRSSKPASKATKSSKPSKRALEGKKQPHKFKTILCSNFGEGRVCKFGDGCIFAHGEHELVKAEAVPEEQTSGPTSASGSEHVALEAAPKLDTPVVFNWPTTQMFDKKQEGL